MIDPKITPSGQTIVKPTALDPVANTDSKLLIYGLFQKGRVLAQDEDEQQGKSVEELDAQRNPEWWLAHQARVKELDEGILSLR